MLLTAGQTDRADIFVRSGPLVLEAGFGSGSFLVHLAQTHPSWNIVGADVARASVARARRRLGRHGITRIRLFRGQAEYLVRDVIRPGSLHRMFVNFPDPWPKQRHRDRRLLTSDFLEMLSTRLAAGGALRLTTDDGTYFSHVTQTAEHSGLYTVDRPPAPVAALRTKYAARWSARQRPIFHARLSRIVAASQTFVPAVERAPMHHASLRGPLPQPDDFTSFRRSFGTGQVVVTGLMKRIGTPALVFEVRVEETDLTQQVLVEARPVGAKVLVGVSNFNQPLSTRGTREAVIAVEGWLLSRGMQRLTAYY